MKRTEGFVYQEIAESLRRLIASGEVKPGDRLTPVRELAQRWHCTPNTVSRAYSLLAREGLVYSKRGGGTRVSAGRLAVSIPGWSWARLVNRAEAYLLEAVAEGHSTTEAEAALSVAVSRWQETARAGGSGGGSSSEIRGDLTTCAGIPGKPPPEAPGGQEELRFAGSHDLSIEIVASLLERRSPDLRMSVSFLGSLGGLMALARGEADVAGTHLWDESTGEYNVPFVRRLLPGKQVALVTLVRRSLGLIVPRGNPQELHGLEDLTRPGVRFVNRQPGSGTRVWLDIQLKTLGIAPSSLIGYQREEATHLAVARAISDGDATAGLGIGAAAAAQGLGFVPLSEERYDLAMTSEVRQAAKGALLMEVVRSTEFRDAVAPLGGYDASDSGNEMWLD